MNKRFLSIGLTTLSILSILMLTVSTVQTRGKVSAASPRPQTATLAQSQLQNQNNLPYPSWWNGTTCDTTKVSNSAPLGTYYRGLPACGPIGLPTNKSTEVTFPGGWGEYEWQCVELSMRFMYLAYGIKAYNANGNEVVDHYTDPTYDPSNYNNPILQPVPNDGSSKTVPRPGDVLSYKTTASFGHTSVVVATNVDSNGNGTITTIEQNSSSTGKAVLKVGANANKPPWVIGRGIKNWLRHTLDVSPQVAPSGSSVNISGRGFRANEQVVMKLGGTQIGTATTDDTGSFSTTITIPNSFPDKTYTLTATGQSSGFSPRTVFYISGSPPPPNPQLNGITAISANDVWAVGYYQNYTTGFNGTLTEHWDGSSWKLVPSPNASSENQLIGVTAVSANDVWAVGYYSNTTGFIGTLVEHWDGTTWKVVPSPGNANYFSVTAVSANDVWAVGYYRNSTGNALIVHWDGSSWKVVPSPNPGNANYLLGVRAVSANDVWTVGYYQDFTGGRQVTLIEHWDGSSWKVIPSPNASSENYLSGVTAVSANDVWAIGSYRNSTGFQGTLVEHWDGTTWKVVPTPNPSSYNILSGVTAVSANDVWAVGYYQNDTTRLIDTLIEHWDGSSWKVVPTPNPGSNNNTLSGVTAVSANGVWAVGSYRNTTGFIGTLVEHWDGTTWKVVPSP